MDAVLNFLAAHQDYPWFLSMLAWGAAGTLWWCYGRTHFEWRWLGWSAAVGIWTAAVEIVLLAIPIYNPSPFVPLHLWGDLLLGLGSCVVITGWRAALIPKRSWWHWVLLAALVLSLAFYREVFIHEGNWIILGLGTLLAGWWWVRLRRESWLLRACLFLAWTTLLCSSHGVLADLAGQTRRHMEVSQVGFAAAIIQLAAGSIAAIWFAQSTLLPQFGASHQHRWREVRQVSRWAVAWLLGGFLLSAYSGWMAQRAFAQSAMTRVEAMAPLIDGNALAKCVGPRLTLVNRRESRQPSGNHTLFASAPAFESPPAWPISKRMRSLLSQNPDVRDLMIRTFSQNEVIIGISGLYAGDVVVDRLISPQDRRDWANRVSDFSGMLYTSYDEVAQARTPLVTSSGEMLGWLVMDLGVSNWIAAQVQARAQALLAVAVGLIALGLWCVQRWREHEGEAALREASLAQAAHRVKSTFLAKVSHELRTPLQSIIGYAEISQSAGSEPERKRYLDSLLQHSRLLTRLVNDLIDLSAIEAGALRLVPQPTLLPQALVEAAGSLQQRATAKGLAFETRVVSEDIYWVQADAERLRQIVLNLLGNAVKYTRAGRVTTEIHCGPGPGDTVEVQLAIIDTGPGIPHAQQVLLFQPFSRLTIDNAEEGTGLGLAIADGLCAQMGGRLTMESDGSTGSTFRTSLRLPRVPAPSGAGTDSATALALRGREILIADDNPLIRELFFAHLSTLGAQCSVAGDGTEAWQLLQQKPYDAAVLDISMPGLDGLTLARKIRRNPSLAGMRLIAASAHARVQDRATAFVAGFDEFLLKPFSMTELARALNAPSGTRVPAEVALRARLGEMFREEAPTQAARLETLIWHGDWPAARTLAHYLKNSAYAVEDQALMKALAKLEAATESANRTSAVAAWNETRQALAPWLSTSPDIFARTTGPT